MSKSPEESLLGYYGSYKDHECHIEDVRCACALYWKKEAEEYEADAREARKNLEKETSRFNNIIRQQNALLASLNDDIATFHKIKDKLWRKISDAHEQLLLLEKKRTVNYLYPETINNE